MKTFFLQMCLSNGQNLLLTIIVKTKIINQTQTVQLRVGDPGILNQSSLQISIRCSAYGLTQFKHFFRLQHTQQHCSSGSCDTTKTRVVQEWFEEFESIDLQIFQLWRLINVKITKKYVVNEQHTKIFCLSCLLKFEKGHTFLQILIAEVNAVFTFISL